MVDMLDNLKALGESMSPDQAKKLKEALGDSLYQLLACALMSSTKPEAKHWLGEFTSSAKESPLKILKARMLLDKDQKRIIMELMNA